MKPPFGLVVVHGDGRVLRASVPRWVAYGTIGLEVAVLAAALAVSGDRALLRREVDMLRERVDDQRALVDAVESRVPVMRSSVAAMRKMNAKMLKALGLERPASEADERPQLHELEHAVARTSRLLARLPLRWPVRGAVNSEYGLRRSPWTGKREDHHGMDIAGTPGTPVKATAAGTVVAANAHGRLGKHVALDHGNGVTSLYGHLQALDVQAGDRVETGQVIGRVGNTGRSTGPHLHYELLVDGKPVDPRTLVEAGGN